MSNLKVLVTDKEQQKLDTKEVLQNALNSDFETVLLLGVKNGHMTMEFNCVPDVAKILGYIEVIKDDFLRRGVNR